MAPSVQQVNLSLRDQTMLTLLKDMVDAS